MTEHKAKTISNSPSPYKVYDEAYNKGRADERKSVLDEFKEKMRDLNQLNCFTDYIEGKIDLEELMNYASEEIAEQLKNREV